ncbi:hypothetical protein [Sphingosinicella microcystinivorans]|uniref:hypothetical protein n=1 Tax=Sphingosinicella microcystinivorans TaxID=335406 RepID=UPI0022F3F7DE|nr:hypothetical protein [Sphingosinicella microcystinivorans]WBX82945.1 hypothetical protein PE061_14110 [Sphingosinicella microcystinivorans]
MAFDDAKLGIADGNLLGPVIGDDDRAIVGRPGSGRRAPLRLGLHIVVQIFETFRPSAGRTAATFAR